MLRLGLFVQIGGRWIGVSTTFQLPLHSSFFGGWHCFSPFISKILLLDVYNTWGWVLCQGKVCRFAGFISYHEGREGREEGMN